jgi:hypothetical protein
MEKIMVNNNKILANFDKLYDKMNDIEKKKFFHTQKIYRRKYRAFTESEQHPVKIHYFGRRYGGLS